MLNGCNLRSVLFQIYKSRLKVKKSPYKETFNVHCSLTKSSNSNRTTAVHYCCIQVSVLRMAPLALRIALTW